MNRRRFFGALAGLAATPIAVDAARPALDQNLAAIQKAVRYDLGRWRYAQFGDTTVVYKDHQIWWGEYAGDRVTWGVDGWDFGKVP